MINRTLTSLRFMREHRWTRTHLSEYIDREPGDRERSGVEGHVGLCPECHRMLATLRHTVSGLRSLGERQPLPPDGVAEGVLGRLREEG